MIPEQTFILIITFIVAVMMIILARKDHNSFKMEQHVNYKVVLSTEAQVFRYFVGWAKSFLLPTSRNKTWGALQKIQKP